MYVACVLMEHGFSLTKPLPEGPDIRIDRTPPIWIEAIAVTAGVGEDAVPNRQMREHTRTSPRGIIWQQERPPSEESLVLRCTSAIATKNAQRTKYVANRIVRATDPFVIAVSLAAIEDAHEVCEFDELSIVFKALYGVGDEFTIIPWESDEDPSIGHHRRPAVKKTNGEEISTEGFRTPTYPGITGVFSSSTSISDLPSEHGSELVFVHNATASTRIEAGTFPFGTEYVPKSDEINQYPGSLSEFSIHRWSTAGGA
jgi:hypothetical protein